MLSARVLVASLAVLLAVPPAASATFPGRNGHIFVTTDEFDRWASRSFMTRVAPRNGQIQGTVGICSQDYAKPDPAHDSDCPESGAAAIAPDGRSAVALTQESEYGNPLLFEALRTLDLRGNQAPPVPLADPIGSHLLRQRFLDYTRVRWSPDGKQFLFDRPETPEGGHAVYVAPVSDPNRRTFVTTGSQVDWAANGRIVVVRRGNLAVGRLGAPFKRITLRGGTQPSWSPDGRWIAFVRKGRLFRIRASGGKARRVGRGKGHSPAWSPDGRQIALLRTIPADDSLDEFLHVIRLRDGMTRRLGFAPDGGWNRMGSDLDRVYAPEWQALPRPRR
jgi:hypothetical protein